MRKADLVSDIKAIGNITGKYDDLVTRALYQEGILRYSTMHPWPHYRDLGYITTIDDYTTGTVSATQNSKTITGSGTTFTVNMVGRKIRLQSETAFYEIAAFVSTTEVTLAVPYQGSDASAVTYSIFQDEYRLTANAYQLLNIRQIEDGTLMLGLYYGDMDSINPDLETQGDPIWFSVIGRRADVYNTGTIAFNSGTKTLTGTNTAWSSVDGLTRGTRIASLDTSQVFTVKEVVSDTEITTYEAPLATEASTTYTAYMDNIVIQVNDVPDAARNLYYRYHRLPAPIIEDYDEPDMPKEHHHFLWWAVSSVVNNLLGKEDTARIHNEKFEALIAEQWVNLSKSAPSVVSTKESTDVSTRLRVGTLRYPSNFGVPLGL